MPLLVVAHQDVAAGKPGIWEQQLLRYMGQRVLLVRLDMYELRRRAARRAVSAGHIRSVLSSKRAIDRREPGRKLARVQLSFVHHRVAPSIIASDGIGLP